MTTPRAKGLGGDSSEAGRQSLGNHCGSGKTDKVSSIHPHHYRTSGAGSPCKIPGAACKERGSPRLCVMLEHIKQLYDKCQQVSGERNAKENQRPRTHIFGGDRSRPGDRERVPLDYPPSVFALWRGALGMVGLGRQCPLEVGAKSPPGVELVPAGGLAAGLSGGGAGNRAPGAVGEPEFSQCWMAVAGGSARRQSARDGVAALWIRVWDHRSDPVSRSRTAGGHAGSCRCKGNSPRRICKHCRCSWNRISCSTP